MLINRQLQRKVYMSKTSKGRIIKMLCFQLKEITKIFSFQLGELSDHLRFFLELSISFPESSSFVRRRIGIKLLTGALFLLPLVCQ